MIHCITSLVISRFFFCRGLFSVVFVSFSFFTLFFFICIFFFFFVLFVFFFFFFFQAEDGIRDVAVTGVQTCALPISLPRSSVTCNPQREERELSCSAPWLGWPAKSTRLYSACARPKSVTFVP